MNDPHAKLANPHLQYLSAIHRKSGHEDQLTRAALIVMKFVPRAHEAMLTMIGCSPLSKLPAPRFDLQTENSSLQAMAMGMSTSSSASFGSRPGVVGFDKVEASERRARYDGVIQYGSKLLVVVESKLFTGVSFGQPKNINPKGSVVWKSRFEAHSMAQKLLNPLVGSTRVRQLRPSGVGDSCRFFRLLETNFGDLLPFTDLVQEESDTTTSALTSMHTGGHRASSRDHKWIEEP